MMRSAIALVGGLLMVAGLAWPSTAVTSKFITDDVVTLAANVSRAHVPDGAAETAVVIAADDELALAAPSLLAALPLHVPLLVTGTGELADVVVEELHRATGRDESATVHLVGAATSAQAQLESLGYSVIPYDGTDPTALAALTAGELFGAPVGTSQRVIVIPPGDELVAALANALGIWLAIPVIPVGANGFTTDAFVREVWAVGNFGSTPSVNAPGPLTIRTFQANDVFELAIELDALGEQEPGDSAPPTVVSTAPIVASASGDTTAALVAATVAARRSLDGDRAPLLLVDGPFSHDFEERCAASSPDADSYCAMAAADGDVTFVGLSTFAPDGQAGDPPLPTTGGGIAIAGAVLLGIAVVKKRRG